MKRFVLILAAMLSLGVGAAAKVTLPDLLGSGMVLQRNSVVEIWGATDGDRAVKVVTSWNGAKYSAKPDAGGNWSVKVSTPETAKSSATAVPVTTTPSRETSAGLVST